MSLLFVLFRRMTIEYSDTGSDQSTAKMPITTARKPLSIPELYSMLTDPARIPALGEVERQKMEQAAAKDPEVAAAIELLKMITNTARRPLADIDWDGDIKVQLLQKLENYAEAIVFDVEDKKHHAQNYKARLSGWTNEPGKDSFSQNTEELEEKYRRLHQALEHFPQLLKRYEELLSQVQAMKSDAV